MYWRVSFCDGSFYDSILRPLSSRTEHSRSVMRHCRKSVGRFGTRIRVFFPPSITVGSHFATVRFTTIQFYDSSRVGPSTPEVWCVTAAKASEVSVQEFGFFFFSSIHYGRVSFCDGSFYDDSILRPLSSRTEHSRSVMRHCRNSSVLSVRSALLALFQCACVSSFFVYFSAVLFSWSWFFHPRSSSKRQKRSKNQNSWRHILSWCLLNHGLGLLQQNKKWFDWYLFSYLCYFLYIYVVCLKSKCTDFLFKCLLDSPEITSDHLQSMTLGKLHSVSNFFSTDHSNTGKSFSVSVFSSSVTTFCMFSVVQKWWPFNFNFNLGKR